MKVENNKGLLLSNKYDYQRGWVEIYNIGLLIAPIK